MPAGSTPPARAVLIWVAFVLALAAPVVAAATSPLLAWRDPIYIAAGFAGIIALCLMIVQPLLAGGYLPGLPVSRGRRVHRWVGAGLVLAVVLHVAGLWITSPPDVIDALLFTSPTLFSPLGVIAMWALFGAALLAAIRRRAYLRPNTWRLAHTALAVVVVLGTVGHAMLIEGAMETVSKALLCGLALAATAKVVTEIRLRARRRTSG